MFTYTSTTNDKLRRFFFCYVGNRNNCFIVLFQLSLCKRTSNEKQKKKHEKEVSNRTQGTQLIIIKKREKERKKKKFISK